MTLRQKLTALLNMIDPDFHGPETAMSYFRAKSTIVHFWVLPEVNLLDNVRICVLAKCQVILSNEFLKKSFL